MKNRPNLGGEKGHFAMQHCFIHQFVFYICNRVAWMGLQLPPASYSYRMQGHIHKTIDRSNRLSAFLSLACAIHCAAMPMLISILPLVGMQFLASHLLEGGMLAFGVGFGAYGVIRAYLYQHRDKRPVVALVAGAVLITYGFFFAPEALEPYLVSAGALGIAAAQVLNMRSCRRCAH